MAITHELGATGPGAPTGESFATVDAPRTRQVLRGVAIVPSGFGS